MAGSRAGIKGPYSQGQSEAVFIRAQCVCPNQFWITDSLRNLLKMADPCLGILYFGDETSLVASLMVFRLHVKVSNPSP